MRKITLALGLVAMLSLPAVLSAQQISATPVFRLDPKLQPDDYLAKNVILQVKNNFRNLCTVNGINNAKINQLLAYFGAQNFQKIYPNHQPPAREFNAQGLRFADLSLIYEFNFTANYSLEKVINAFLATGMFEYVEPHYVPKVGLTTNDPQATNTSSSQWNVFKIAAAGTGTTGWNISTGDSNIVIGITDTGWDPSHSDLDSNVKHNYADPINGADDDGDGYVDNFTGWDVGQNDNNPTYGSCGNCFHGVHVAGIAAAETNNNTGIAGTAYNCMFMPVKVADATGALTAAYNGIVYAADHGCSIINCSWGGQGGGNYGQTIITYATINKNALVVASTGNDGVEVTNYPCSYDYCISVVNTRINDQKDPSSTYAYSADVSAPGNNIMSTMPGNTYSQLSGTSMASPCAAGAAAIIKSYFPSYDAQQIGARLKQTTDNIYGVPGNAFYSNKMGTGRINLYKALTDPVNPYFDLVSKNIIDNNDNAFVIGDTLFIRGNYINYFGTSGSVTATLAPAGTNLTTIDNSTTLGVINQNQVVDNNADPFKFVINAGTPVNSVITFTLTLTDGSVTNTNFFSVTVNVDYINITINDVYTTATSKGRIGFNDNALSVGLGFQYSSTQMLAEAGFMCGASSTKVSDCVRDVSGNAMDFTSVTNISEITPAMFSQFDLTGKFNDNLAASPMNLIITHNEYAWSTPGNTKYVIFEYKIKNNAATTLSNFYAGIFADFDIDGTTYAQNKGAYDATNKMGYTYHTAANGLYAGIKLLTSTAPPNFYALDNVAGGGGAVDANSGGFSDAEKYTTLSTQRLQSSNNVDVLEVMGSGPFTINAGDTITVAFALIAGDDLTDLQTSAVNAQTMYDGLPTTVASTVDKGVMFVYPNPAKDQMVIDFGVPVENGTITIYNAMGQAVMTMNVNGSKTIVATEKLPNGNYFCRLVSNNKMSVKKFVVGR